MPAVHSCTNVNYSTCLTSTSTIMYVSIQAEWEIEETKPAESWPAEGRVIVENYSTRYREGLDLVLKDVSFTIEPAEKVFVCVRSVKFPLCVLVEQRELDLLFI